MVYKRITPESVVAAYMVTGMRPTKRIFKSPDRCCALGALSLAAAGGKAGAGYELFENGFALLKQNLGSTSNYINGFVVGFDGLILDVIELTPWGLDGITGHEDGVAAWEAIRRPG